MSGNKVKKSSSLTIRNAAFSSSTVRYPVRFELQYDCLTEEEACVVYPDSKCILCVR
jgi:hypothetical protein